MTPEGKIKKKIDAMLKSKRGVWFFKPQSGPFGKSGVPDYIICVASHFFAIEAKSGANKKPTALQYKAMDGITKEGHGICMVVYDDDTLKVAESIIDDTLRNLETIERLHAGS